MATFTTQDNVTISESVTISVGAPAYSIVVVAGGGGGGAANGSPGGGGAGGLIEVQNVSTSFFTGGFVVTIGNGGVTSTYMGATGENGGDTTFGSLFTAIGGGGGGTYAGAKQGANGGSGGGGAGTGLDYGYAGGTRTFGQGTNGNTSTSGGGGQGGGLSRVTFITGSSLTLAVGGGGGLSGGSGTANTGNGAGGSDGHVTSGGSGVVIVNFPTTGHTWSYDGSFTTGTTGSQTWVKMTTSGTFLFDTQTFSVSDSVSSVEFLNNVIAQCVKPSRETPGVKIFTP